MDLSQAFTLLNFLIPVNNFQMVLLDLISKYPKVKYKDYHRKKENFYKEYYKKQLQVTKYLL